MDSGWLNRGRGVSRPRAEMMGLETLMERYAARVYDLALDITRNKADAEEVVQDVFFSVVRKIDTFEGRSALGTWVHRICINAALNKRRSRRFVLRPSMEHLSHLRPGRVRVGGVSRASSDWTQLPDHRLLRKEARAALRTALEELPDHYRAVVLLRDVEELPSADVAKVLQESEPCIKSRLHRARLVLRERLGYYFSDRPIRSNAVAAGQCPRSI